MFCIWICFEVQNDYIYQQEWVWMDINRSITIPLCRSWIQSLIMSSWLACTLAMSWSQSWTPRAWSSFSLSPRGWSLYEWRRWGAYLSILIPGPSLPPLFLIRFSMLSKTWRAQLQDLLCVSSQLLVLNIISSLPHTVHELIYYFTYTELCNWRLWREKQILPNMLSQYTWAKHYEGAPVLLARVLKFVLLRQPRASSTASAIRDYILPGSMPVPVPAGSWPSLLLPPRVVSPCPQEGVWLAPCGLLWWVYCSWLSASSPSSRTLSLESS